MSDSTAPPASWEEISDYAKAFAHLAAATGIDRAITLGDRVRGQFAMGTFSASPRELAACLAFECRNFQHCGLTPTGDDLTYLSALFNAVRKQPPE